VAAVLPFARERYGARLDVRVFEAAVALGQVRATTFVQIAEQAEFLFTPDDELAIDDASWEKVQKIDKAVEVLDATIAHVESCEWTLEGVELKDAIEALGVKARKVMAVVYAAIEGRAAGLPVYDSILLLGRESALHRLRAARQRLAA
jgi:glutamyl-tRNA synthetase